MKERKILIDSFLNTMTRHLLWIKKHPVEENEVISHAIIDNDSNEFEIASYHDGALSLDRKGYVTHMAFVHSINDIDTLLNCYLSANGLEGITEEDL